MRFITKKHLPRRTFLRGVGVAVALAAAGFHGARANAAGARPPPIQPAA